MEAEECSRTRKARYTDRSNMSRSPMIKITFFFLLYGVGIFQYMFRSKSVPKVQKAMSKEQRVSVKYKKLVKVSGSK